MYDYPHRALLTYLAVALLGFAFSFGAYFGVGYLEETQDWESFVEQANINFSAIQDGINRNAEVAYSVGRFFDASQHVDAQEFSVFVGPEIGHGHGIEYIAWAPLVPADDREQAEKVLQTYSLSTSALYRLDEDFRRRPLDTDGMQPLYPIVISETRTEKVDLIGLDLLGFSEFSDAIDAANRTGEMVAATSSRFDRFQGGHRHLVTFRPVYHPTRTTGDEWGIGQPHGIKGFTLQFARFETVVHRYLDDIELPSRNYFLTVYEMNSKKQRRRLYPDNITTDYMKANRRARSRDKLIEMSLHFGGQAFEIEFFQSRHHSAPVYSRISVFVLGAGITVTILIVLLFNRSTTIRESQLREGTTRAIIRTTSIGIVTTGHDQLIQDINPAAEEIFGYFADEVSGQHLSYLFGDSGEEGVGPATDSFSTWSTETPPRQGVERTATKKSGDKVPIWLALDSARIGGDVLKVYSVLDISDQKAAEREIVKARRAAENANMAKSDFLGVVSHELRSPLTIILGYIPFISRLKTVELVPNERTLPEIQRLAEHLDRQPLSRPDIKTAVLGVFAQLSKIGASMDQQGRQLERLISDLLDVSKIEAGKMQLLLKNVELPDIAESVVESFGPGAEAKGIEIVVDCDDSLVVKADETRIRQVLANLISNAIKFTDEGSISVRVTAEGNNALVEVRDTGCGIPQEACQSIFDRFVQTRQTLSQRKGGTGLGLAICKQLVDLHQGRIWVESTPGKGSSFFFTIPLPFLV